MPHRLHGHFYDQPWFWDALIALLLVSAAIASLIFWNLLHAPLLALPWIVGFCLTFYGSFIEPKLLILNKKCIHINGMPEVRIVAVSDLHTGPYKQTAFVERIVRRINALEPDIIVLLGDFIEHEQVPLAHLRPLKQLHAKHGIFAITGNHDAGRYLDIHGNPYRTVDRTEDIQELLEGMGIIFLRNNHRIIKVHDRAIAFAGIDDTFMETSSLSQALSNIASNIPIILLSHNPDIIRDTLVDRCALVLSGHTHGGQIRLPFIGPLGPIPTRISRRFDQGLFELNKNCTLFISHGCGETWARARLFCPPEIVIMEVKEV